MCVYIYRGLVSVELSKLAARISKATLSSIVTGPTNIDAVKEVADQSGFSVITASFSSLDLTGSSA